MEEGFEGMKEARFSDFSRFLLCLVVSVIFMSAVFSPIVMVLNRSALTMRHRGVWGESLRAEYLKSICRKVTEKNCWIYKSGDRELDKNTTVLIYTTAAKTQVEIHFSPLNNQKHCYKRTKYFNVSYKVDKKLAVGEELVVNRVIDSVKKAEGMKYADPDLYGAIQNTNTAYVREMSLVAIAFLTLVFVLLNLLIFMVQGNATGLVNMKLHGPPEPGFALRLSDMGFLATILFVFAVKVAMFPYKYIDIANLLSVPTWRVFNSFSNYLLYVVGDAGNPGVLYRIVLPVAFMLGNVNAIFIENFIFGFLLIVSVYIILRQRVRSWIAWGVPIYLSFNPLFNYGLSSLRGYIIYPLATVLTVYLFDRLVKRQSPAFLILWFVVLVLNFISYPVTIAVAGGQFIHFIFVKRRSMPRTMRLRIDTSFVFLLLAMAAYTPYIAGAFASNINIATGENRYPYEIFMHLNAFNFAFAMFLLVWGFITIKKYETTLIVSAGCGLFFEMLLQALLIMGSLDRYFLFIAPLVFACIGILIEKLLTEYREDGRKLIIAGGMALVIIMTVFSMTDMESSAISYDKYASMERSFKAVDRILDRKNDDKKPTMLFPLDFYLTYVFQRCNANYFDKIPPQCNGHKTESENEASPEGYFSIGGIYYFARYPAKMAADDFRIIAFGKDLEKLGGRPYGSRCIKSETINKYRIVVLDCVRDRK